MMKSHVIERNMFYGACRSTFDKAHRLRRDMTEAEKIMWNVLKNRCLFKVRFRRQHPIDIFIVDFYCHELKLAIEIDGGIHLNEKVAEYDDGRIHDIEKFGIKILRFKNDQVFKKRYFVIKEILKTITSLSSM
ncbi:MAG: endonuclease domain-containing protein [Bacteroidales bacterium]|nr:endonuclease domain-containing protein [Bacteroidales bacterium]